MFRIKKLITESKFYILNSYIRTMEKIVQIPFAENYLISELGYVINSKTNKKLKPRLNDRGYESIVLYVNAKPKSYRIGRLVLSVFDNKDYISYEKEANHINENKLDNRLINLNWLSRKENMNWNNLQSKIKRSNSISENAINAAKKANSKPIKGISINDGSIIIFGSMAEAKQNGFNIGNISACCLGKRIKHKGYKWEFQTANKS